MEVPKGIFGFLPGRTIVLLSASLMSVFWNIAINAQQIPDSLSFGQTVEIALANDNNVQAARAVFDASTNDIARARADYYPKLFLAGNYSHVSLTNELSLNLPFPGGDRKIKIATDNPFSTGFTMTGEIFTFGRRPAAVAVAGANNRTDELRYKNMRKIIFDLAARAYISVVFCEQSSGLLRTESRRFDLIAKLVEDRYALGTISEYEVLQTKLRQENYRSSAIEMTNNLASARLNLAKLLNIPEEKLPGLIDNLDDSLLIIPAADSWQDIWERREDYLDAHNAVEKAKSIRRIAKSGYFPDVSLFASYLWRNGNQPDLNQIKGSYSLGINLNWLLFDGFGRRAEIRKNDQLIKAASISADEYRRTIPNQIKNQFLMLQNSRSKIEIQAKALALAEKAMSIARTRFEIGDLTMIEFLDTENNLALAELGLLKSKLDYLVNQLDLKKVTGFYPEFENK
jgi:outer membrane protein TolC